MEEILFEIAIRMPGMLIFYILRKSVKHLFKSTDIPHSIPDIYGTDLLRVIMKENNIQRHEIQHIFGSEVRWNSIFKDGQTLTASEIEQLSNFFKISPIAFFKTSLAA